MNIKSEKNGYGSGLNELPRISQFNAKIMDIFCRCIVIKIIIKTKQVYKRIGTFQKTSFELKN